MDENIYSYHKQISKYITKRVQLYICDCQVDLDIVYMKNGLLS